MPYVMIKVSEEQLSKVIDLRRKLSNERFSKVFLEWIDKLLVDIALSDGGLFIVH